MMENRFTLKGIGKVTVKIITALFLLLVTCVVVSTAAHQILKAIERGRYPAPGELVTVDGKKMHVYSAGSGSKTIVLLSGYGTGSPVIDFAPLIKELSKNYKVVVAENFGYGWSDVTGTPRTAGNIVNETRTALLEAGIKPPYILMPHSIGGIYSLYYANTYPEEVEGIVGTDTSVPAQIKVISNGKKMSGLAALEEITGFIRIRTKFNPSSVIKEPDADAYTKDEIKLMRLMYCWHANNTSLINEANQIYANFEAVQNMKYPKSMPVLNFLSKETTDGFATLGMDWVSMHEQIVTENKASRSVVLEGGHYLHRTCSEKMAEEMQSFLK